MRFIFAFLLSVGSTVAQAPQTDALAKHGLEQLWLDVAKHPNSYTRNCDSSTAARRREWFVRATTRRMSLTPHRSKLKRLEKLNYIEAVHCMGKTKARTPAAVASGAISRYDDFVVTHILLTQYTHGNVFFVKP